MKLLSMLALVGFVLITGCETVEDQEQDNKILYTKKITSSQSLLFHLSNTDVTWTRGKVGLEPKVVGKASELLLERGKVVNVHLLRGLKKPNKFAACHVLLTKLNLDGYFPLSFKKWNRLTVKLRVKEETEYDSAQIPDLVKFWKDALALKDAERRKKSIGGE